MLHPLWREPCMHVFPICAVQQLQQNADDYSEPPWTKDCNCPLETAASPMCDNHAAASMRLRHMTEANTHQRSITTVMSYSMMRTSWSHNSHNQEVKQWCTNANTSHEKHNDSPKIKEHKRYRMSSATMDWLFVFNGQLSYSNTGAEKFSHQYAISTCLNSVLSARLLRLCQSNTYVIEHT